VICSVELGNEVIKKGLCTGCGACQGLCPYWLSYRGKTIHMFSCEREDGRCYVFCPRTKTDLVRLREEFFPGVEYIPEIGPFLGLYMTRATDEDIRSRGQHGGTATALVELALQEGLIDAAVLTDGSGEMNPQGVLVTKAKDVRKYAGSRFQIPPTLSTLNKALKEDKYKKIGVVGTPCKTLATYKMKSKPYPDNDNNAGNIGMIFGLFCGWGLDWDGVENLVGKYAAGKKVKHMDILPSMYHKMVMKTAKKDFDVPLEDVYAIIKGGCNYCIDMTAEFSDLSIGGARSAAGWEVDQGWNQVIVRTEQGKKLLDLARKKKILEFKKVGDGNLEKIKKASLNKKKTALKNLKKIAQSADDFVYLDPEEPGVKKARLDVA